MYKEIDMQTVNHLCAVNCAVNTVHNWQRCAAKDMMSNHTTNYIFMNLNIENGGLRWRNEEMKVLKDSH